MLADFIAGNREQIVRRYRAKAATSLRVPLDAESEYAALVFLDGLLSALRFGSNPDTDAPNTVHHTADDVIEERLIVPLAAPYGDICESVTELAMEMKAPINVTEFATLDRYFDEATALAVADSVSEPARTGHVAVLGGSERLRVFQHEVRKLVNEAILSFDVLRTGKVGLEGSTGRLLHRSLIESRSLADRVDGDAD